MIYREKSLDADTWTDRRSHGRTDSTAYRVTSSSWTLLKSSYESCAFNIHKQTSEYIKVVKVEMRLASTELRTLN